MSQIVICGSNTCHVQMISCITTSVITSVRILYYKCQDTSLHVFNNTMCKHTLPCPPSLETELCVRKFCLWLMSFLGPHRTQSHMLRYEKQQLEWCSLFHSQWTNPCAKLAKNAYTPHMPHTEVFHEQQCSFKKTTESHSSETCEIYHLQKAQN